MPPDAVIPQRPNRIVRERVGLERSAEQINDGAAWRSNANLLVSLDRKAGRVNGVPESDEIVNWAEDEERKGDDGHERHCQNQKWSNRLHASKRPNYEIS